MGFTFTCGKTRAGKFQLRRRSRRDRMKAKLRMIKDELRQRMHQPIPKQGRWLERVVRGYFNYHAVPTNARALDAFRAPCASPLAAHAAASQPKGSAHVGADDATGGRVGFPNRSSSILGQANASPSHTRGGSRMRASRTYGSVRGARHETRVPTATPAKVHHAARRCDGSGNFCGACSATGHAGSWVPGSEHGLVFERGATPSSICAATSRARLDRGPQHGH